jgi:hypothetical protein
MDLKSVDHDKLAIDMKGLMEISISIYLFVLGLDLVGWWLHLAL